MPRPPLLPPRHGRQLPRDLEAHERRHPHRPVVRAADAVSDTTVEAPHCQVWGEQDLALDVRRAALQGQQRARLA